MFLHYLVKEVANSVAFMFRLTESRPILQKKFENKTFYYNLMFIEHSNLKKKKISVHTVIFNGIIIHRE